MLELNWELTPRSLYHCIECPRGYSFRNPFLRHIKWTVCPVLFETLACISRICTLIEILSRRYCHALRSGHPDGLMQELPTVVVQPLAEGVDGVSFSHPKVPSLKCKV